MSLHWVWLAALDFLIVLVHLLEGLDSRCFLVLLVLTPASFCRTEPLRCYDNFEIQTNLSLILNTANITSSNVNLILNLASIIETNVETIKEIDKVLGHLEGRLDKVTAVIRQVAVQGKALELNVSGEDEAGVCSEESTEELEARQFFFFILKGHHHKISKKPLYAA